MSSATKIWSSDDDDSSFRSCLFLFLFLLIVDIIQRQNSERQSTHTFTLNIAFASSHNDQPLLLLQHLIVNPLNVQQCFLYIGGIRFFLLCLSHLFAKSQIACVFIYDVQRIYLFKNEWLFHRYKPVGYIHSCHHYTYLYIHSIGENRNCLFSIPHAPIPPLYAHTIYTYIYLFLLSLSRSSWGIIVYRKREREKYNGWVSSWFATNRIMHDVFAVRQVNTVEKEKSQ
jgi:hypothetical protein